MEAPLLTEAHPRAARRIVLLYRRGVQPDEALLEALAASLSHRGCEVFWDRHLTVGMHWAQELQRRIREADAVVPLISECSMRSEMIAMELHTARDAAGEQGGRPQILPVRVRYTGPLPEELATLIGALEYAEWGGPGDLNRLVEELFAGMQAPPSGAEGATPGLHSAASSPLAAVSAAPVRAGGVTAGAARPSPDEFEPAGGAVPLDSPYYIERPSDRVFLTAVRRGDSVVLVNGARQMGKTSLLARGLQVARESGARVAMTDFQWIGAGQLETSETLLRGLSDLLADQLDLEVLPGEVWRAGAAPTVNFQRYLRRAVLADGGPRLVWGLDEVDRLFDRPFGSEVFGLFRSWHNARALDPEGPWSRLTLAIAYATEAHLFITDVNQSPFNVGTRVTLSDFTREETAELDARYGSVLGGEIDRLYDLLEGHPYLTRRALNELRSGPMGMAELEAAAARDDGPFGDHLRRILMLLARDPDLVRWMAGVLRGEGCPSPESFYRFRSAGLVAGSSPRDARPRCRLYREYLTRHLA